MSVDEKAPHIASWHSVELNDGHSIPSIAYGTWKRGNGDSSTDLFSTAIETGFSHLDTAEAYRNEEELGKAIRDSGLAREDLFVTSKYAALEGNDIETALKQSLEKVRDNLGLTYVDLYLIHHPSIVKPDIPSAWAQMEAVKKAGLAKSIGVSNFETRHLSELLENSIIKPAVNQIEFHPAVYALQEPTVSYCVQKGIVIEGYSPLRSLSQAPEGRVVTTAKTIADRLHATPDQVLLAWAKSKGAIVITSSTKKERLEGYIDAGDLLLTANDIADLESSGQVDSTEEKRLPAFPIVILLLFILYLIHAWQNSGCDEGTPLPRGRIFV